MTTLRRYGGTIQESFFATVEAFESDGHVRVTTVSTDGEEGTAWIAEVDFPVQLRGMLRLGTVLVITVEALGTDAINTIYLVS